jgi:hydrogenase nickel incorporation protein HypB
MSTPLVTGRHRPADPVARQNRALLREAGVHTVALFGGPGCGKTALLQATLQGLPPDLRVAVIGCAAAARHEAPFSDGDGDGDGDGEAADARVIEVRPSDAGLLSAADVRDALRYVGPAALDLLLIENVGTLTLPGLPDLGQDVSAAMFSVAAGHDQAIKHPEIVRTADVVVLNKVDLLPVVPFDLAAFRKDVTHLRPEAELIELSALAGTGVGAWFGRIRPPARPRRVEQVSHWFG